MILTPSYQVSKNFQKPIIGQKIKIIVWGCFIAQMKRFDALITMQKNPSSLRSPISLKIKKNLQKMVFFLKCHFGRFFWIFSKMGLRTVLGFF